MFGQLNKCLSLREISLGINQSPKFIADIGLSQSPTKSIMSDGNTKLDYQVFEHLHLSRCKHFKCELSQRAEYKAIKEIEVKHIKIIDATIMSVSLNLFSWAEYRTAKGGYQGSCVVR